MPEASNIGSFCNSYNPCRRYDMKKSIVSNSKGLRWVKNADKRFIGTRVRRNDVSFLTKSRVQKIKINQKK